MLKLMHILKYFTENGMDGKKFSTISEKEESEFIMKMTTYLNNEKMKGPCNKLYKEMNSKGLEIVGVSLDRDMNSWRKAIEDDGLIWSQISNLQFWQDPIAKLYNISAIPAAFLIDSEGRILAKNLRGERLKEKVKELLN